MSIQSRVTEPASHDELASLREEVVSLRAELESRRALAAIGDPDRWLRTLADALPQIVWVTRPDGYHLYYNRHWFEYTGLTYEEARGEGWSLLLHPDDRQRSIDRWDHALRTGEPYEIEYRFKRASDGVFRWFLGRALPVRNEQGEITQWFGTCTDIDDRKKAEEELQRSNREKDQFLAVMSHELRTPLSAILGYAQLLQLDMLTPEERTKAIASIENNAKAQAQLIEDILDVSRIISGKLKVDAKLVDAKRIVRAGIDSVELSAVAKQVTIESEFPTTNCLVFADPARLQQVVWNLLTNAIKFSSPGGRVRVRLDWVEASTRIEVMDQGRGIPAEFLPHVFERFRQADSTSTRQQGGLGLGLAITRHLVELHNGTIEAYSEGENQGARFTVTLPTPVLRPEDHYDHGDRAATTKTLESLGRVRVLLVDDEASVRNVLATMVSKCGAKVRTAENAKIALKLLAEERPDILVCDLAMPDMDGYALIRQIRDAESKTGRRLPVIALTAYASSDDKSRALAAGFDLHLAKPVEPIQLVAAIAGLAHP